MRYCCIAILTFLGTILPIFAQQNISAVIDVRYEGVEIRRETAVRERCTFSASCTVVNRVLTDNADRIATSYLSSSARRPFFPTVLPSLNKSCKASCLDSVYPYEVQFSRNYFATFEFMHISRICRGINARNATTKSRFEDSYI